MLNLKEPIISVLMSCYNASAYLAEAIESILAQTYGDYEFILIDDGSTDDTGDIIREYATRDRRIVVVAKRNTGLTHSLNVGLSLAKGHLVARMDADDISLPERFQVQVSWLGCRADVGVLGTGCRFIDASGKATGTTLSAFADHDTILHQITTPGRGVSIVHPSVMMRKDVILCAGGYNERMLAAQDSDLWLRVCGMCKLQVIPDVLLSLRKHEGNVSVVHGQTQLLSCLLTCACHYARRSQRHGTTQWSEEAWSQLAAVAAEIAKRTGLLKAHTARAWVSCQLADSRGASRCLKAAKALISNPQSAASFGFRRRWYQAVQQVTEAAVGLSSHA